MGGTGSGGPRINLEKKHGTARFKVTRNKNVKDGNKGLDKNMG